jgi:hypothetical protein
MKTVDFDVPFISNTPSDKQCLQAAYGMIRQYFEPQIHMEWDRWAEITGFVPEKGTWSMAGLMWFKDHGYDVVHIAEFDYVDFALRGPEYLVDALDEEVAKWDIKFTDFKLEQARAARFLRTGIWVKRAPTINDMRAYLADGYLLKCTVNLNALNGKPGYLSHALVVKGITDTEVIMHDPGLPGVPNRRASIEEFKQAWGHPGMPDSEKLDAIKKLPIHGRIHRHFGKSATRKRLVAQEPIAV